MSVQFLYFRDQAFRLCSVKPGFPELKGWSRLIPHRKERPGPVCYEAPATPALTLHDPRWPWGLNTSPERWHITWSQKVTLAAGMSLTGENTGMSGELAAARRSMRGEQKDKQELHALQPHWGVELPCLSSQVAEIKLEKSTLSENPGRWEKYLSCAVSEGSSRAACALHYARERDNGGKERGNILHDLCPIYDLLARIYVQVTRKRNNLITPALAASTMNLPVVLTGDI